MRVPIRDIVAYNDFHPPASIWEAQPFAPAELTALRLISKGKVHACYLNDPLIGRLLDLKLVTEGCDFLRTTSLGAIILEATAG